MNYCLPLFIRRIFRNLSCFIGNKFSTLTVKTNSQFYFDTSTTQCYNSTEIRQFPIAVRRLKIRVNGLLAIQLTMLGAVIARFKMKT